MRNEMNAYKIIKTNFKRNKNGLMQRRRSYQYETANAKVNKKMIFLTNRIMNR